MIYWFPLTLQERGRIRNGVTISKHFHMDPTGQVLMVFVGKTKVRESACEELLRSGTCATSIALTDVDLANIEKGDGVFAQYHKHNFEVGVISQESLDKLNKNPVIERHEKEAS